MSSKLWPQPIPIIGGTGEFQSGKTRFGVSICPGPETLVYDFEQSSASYEYIGFERIDVQKEMHARFPNGYKPTDLWSWFLSHIRSIPAGKYRVIMLDPATDIERGLTDWVSANPTFFGHTFNQYQRMSGIMWGDVKDYLKMILADICARCETFYFTAHVGSEFKDNKATDVRKVKGKSTLQELASLFLWFDRSPNQKGERPNAPRAKVMKGRLEVGKVIDGEVVSYQVLPPVMPVATPKAIREYFANPAGRKVLEDGERFVEERLSDDDRLRLQVSLAEANRDAAALQLEIGGGVQASSVPAQKAPTAPAKIGPGVAERKAEFAAQIEAAATEAALVFLASTIRAAYVDHSIDEAVRTWLSARYKVRLAALRAAPIDAAKSEATPVAT